MSGNLWPADWDATGRGQKEPEDGEEGAAVGVAPGSARPRSRVPRTIFGWPAPLQIPLPEGPRDEAGSRRGRIEPSLENRLAFLSFRPVTNGFLKDRLDRLLDPNSWR